MTKLFGNSNLRRIAAPLVAGAFAAATFLPSIASAQALQGNLEIQGTIQSINGAFDISVADSQGYLDDVQLHQGTIINPTGLTLAPGMSVTIDGYSNGSQFDANEIDTPYHYSGPAPVPVYYGPGVWYPGFNYGYGPSFSLVIGTGPYLVERPWVGHWYVSTPIQGYSYHQFVGPQRFYPQSGQQAYRQPAAGWNGGYRQPQQPYTPGYRQTQPAQPTYLQQQPGSSEYRQPVTPSYRQAQPAQPTYRQQRPAPSYRQAQPAAPAYRQMQPAYRQSQPAARTAAPAGRSYSNNHAGAQPSAPADRRH